MSLTFANHVYLVSQYTTANISPVLDSLVRPQRVILVVSTDMAKNAELLADVLKQAVGVQVELWMIDDAWDIEHIMTRIMEL
ncbi:MAG: DUF1887 family protein, partial [Gammaproteobacteria bacterium]|nr:DUF1887 family protein [Gammaproteobacteria bacterium]